jgi:protease-4
MKKVLLFFLIIFLITVTLSLVMTFSRKVGFGEKVALVRVSGMIIDSTGVIDELRDYDKDPSIKAIVLRINSPGGAVAPSQEIYEEIKKIKKKKKIVVSMGAVAASGGYYIAAPADRIVANPGTLTGSIGVIMELPNVSELMKKIGVETQVIKSGRHKDMASVFKKLGPEEKKILQDVLDDVHEQFIQAVSEARGIDFAEIRKLADGRIFTGRKAKELGLIDKIGNLRDAIMLAGELSGIKGEPQVVTREDEFSFLDLLKNKFAGALSSESFRGISVKYLMSL